MMSKLMEKLDSQQMADLFADEIAAHDAMEEDWRQRSNGVFARSFATAHVAEGSGAEFLDWFWAGYGGDRISAMLRAHPEHLGVLALPDGRVGHP
ncbi:hypothetical protein ACTMU2_20915 [Cupriavidus basilensis]